MASEVWLGLSERERQVLRHALSAYARGEAADRTAVNALVEKIVSAPPRPDIAIGVYGGQVQWTTGNPFPLRIVDYDGEKDDLSDADENGDPCRIWFEPSDEARAAEETRLPSRTALSPPSA
jgi:hypothetical protein